MSSVKLKAVRKSYGNVEVIKGVDLDVPNKEFVVFVGPSGCGKSTLLRMIAGLEHITDGDLEIGGERMNEVDPSKRGIAMVFQSYALYPHMTVRENMGFALRFAGVAKEQIAKQVLDAARILALEPLLDRLPKELSGGKRQRVAIGRAIVRNPTAFLLDEPLSNLDAELRISTRAELAALHKRLSATMIYVTHDQIEAMTLAHRIVVLRAGRIEQVGTPLDLYNRPANLFVAGFIGAPRMNFVDAAAMPVAANAAGATLGVRPHHISLVEAGAGDIAAEVTLVEALGAETVLHMRAAEKQTLLAVVPGQPEVSAGQTVHLRFDRAQLHFFDKDGKRV